MKVQIKADFNKLGSWIKDVGGKQIPFVTAKSLTDLVGEVQKAHTKQLARTFKIRSQYVANSFRKVRAEKSDWPHCQAQEGSRLSFMQLQSIGGVKRDKRGLPLGVPMAKGELLGARPTIDSIIKRSEWVNKLLNRKNFVRLKSTKSNTEVIVKEMRTGKGKKRKKRSPHHAGKRIRNRKSMYVIKNEVKIPPRFRFEEEARDVVASKYSDLFLKNLNESLK